MKNFCSFIPFYVFVVFTIIFTGCSKEDESFSPQNEVPTLTFEKSSNYTFESKKIKAGTQFTTKVSATAGSKSLTLNRYKVSVAYDNAMPVMILDTVLNTTTFEHTFRHNTRPINGKETWIFEVTDSHNQVRKRQLNLNTLVAYADIATEFIAGNSLTSADTEIGLSTSFQVKLMAYSNMSGQNLKNIQVLVSYDSQPFVPYPSASLNIDAENYLYTFNGITRTVSGTEQYKFVVSDSSRESSNILSFTVATPVTSVNTFASIILGGQLNTSIGAFLDANTGSTYYQIPATQNSQNIDLIYFLHNTMGAMLLSPHDTIFGTGLGQIGAYNVHTWAVKNATSFKTLGFGAGTAFDLANTPASIANEYNNSTVPVFTRATNLSIGSVVAFKTADNYYGLLKVNNFTGAPGSGNPAAGSMAVSIKIQAP